VKSKRGRAGKAAKEKQLLGAPKPTVGKASVPVAVVLAAARASVFDAETRLRDAIAAAVTPKSALATAGSCARGTSRGARAAGEEASECCSERSDCHQPGQLSAALQGKSAQRAPAELLAEA
jgi:hypothetical protein